MCSQRKPPRTTRFTNLHASTACIPPWTQGLCNFGPIPKILYVASQPERVRYIPPGDFRRRTHVQRCIMPDRHQQLLSSSQVKPEVLELLQPEIETSNGRAHTRASMKDRDRFLCHPVRKYSDVVMPWNNPKPAHNFLGLRGTLCLSRVLTKCCV